MFDPSKAIKKMLGPGVKTPKFGKPNSADLDGDGISNIMDCQPKNMFRQDLSPAEKQSFEKANNVIHKVEEEWHYDIMKKYGFVPLIKKAKGLVRHYKYKKGNHIIKLATGYSSDYWVDENTKTSGYQGELNEHLKNLKEVK